MRINEIPSINLSDNETHCCPRFHPEAWEGQELHFDNKLFARATTTSVLHVPLNMGAVFEKTWGAIKAAHADGAGYLVLSHDQSAWRAEHLFAVDREVPGVEMVRLSGTYLARVFEGPFSDARSWCDEMSRWVREQGRLLERIYLFYTTCPRCAKHYGKNYVVGIAQVAEPIIAARWSDTRQQAVAT